MKTTNRFILFCSTAFFLTSPICSNAQTLNLNSLKKAVTTSGIKTSSLSTDEITKGLKSALVVGATNASTKLSKTDGFFRDAAIKILLPPEAQSIMKNVAKIPGGQKLVDDVVFRMNRAAEDAAISAKPIFINAITSMSITDALSILNGSDNAATNYLKKSSSSALTAAFQPKIEASLNKKIIGNISAAESWRTLMNANNKAAKSFAGRLAGMKTVNSNLSGYVTEKAIKRIFVKIAEEEKLIRFNPSARVNDVLKKVFSSVSK
jgi:hypothetical protein